ncbi:MAG: hypothetical protein H6810_05270 [Phycisphaeraceae bacterium]|nr:MAG: hypothetical protein H6810_05270 [Phycisphaeraceae bacterium]
MVSPFFFASLLPAFLLFLLLYSAIRSMAHGLTLPKELRAHSAAGVCGACGYPVTWGHKAICPECGRPHAEAGILTPVLAKKMRPTAGTVVAGWTFVMLVVLGLASVALAVLGSAGFGDVALAVAIAGTMLVLLGVYIAGIVMIFRRRARLFAPPPRADTGARDHAVA